MSRRPKFGVVTKPKRDKPRKRPGRHKKRLNKSEKRQQKKRRKGRKRQVDKCPQISYIGYMKEKEINIKVSNITAKQWSNLLIELNLVKDAWRSYGPILKLKATGLDRIIKWGKKKHDAKED